MRSCLVTWLIGTSAGLSLPQDPNGAQEEFDQAQKNEEFYKGRSGFARRTNGVRMQLAASVQAGQKGDELRLDWTLDYDGPRPPLAILEPDLARDTGGQTVAVFYAEGKNRRPHEYQMASPANIGRGSLSPETFFVSVKKEKDARGAIAIALAKLRDAYRNAWPDQFGANAPVLRVQLWHKPFDRGAAFDLDAWTGEVYSPLVKVPLKKW